jgi:glycine cleavage system H protein
MNTPETLKYSKTHEWVKELDEGVVEIGLTDYAQDALGSIVFVNLPDEYDGVSMGEAFGDVESVKAVSDVFSPVSGTVKEVNEALFEAPEMINEAPYDAWLIRVEAVTEIEDLLDAAAYEAVCAQED